MHPKGLDWWINKHISFKSSTVYWLFAVVEFIESYLNCIVNLSSKLILFFSSFSDPGPHLLHIQVEDDNEADLYSKFQTACTFIGNYDE